MRKLGSVVLNLIVGIATGLVMLIGVAVHESYAGSKAREECRQDQIVIEMKWHTSLEQPEGGHVTIDAGLNGVDHTTTIWQQLDYVPVEIARANMVRFEWRDAEGNVLATKDKPVEKSVGSLNCGANPTTTVPVTTTQPETTTSTERPVESSVSASTTIPVPTGPTRGTEAPTPTQPVLVTGQPPVPTTVVLIGTPEYPVLPETGPGEQIAGMIIMGIFFLALGLAVWYMVKNTR